MSETIERHLEAGAAAGIISAGQAAELASFIAARESGDEADDVDAESVRFARGFHDVFLTIGLSILMIGTGFTAGLIVGAFAGLVLAVLTWVLAEFYSRRRRLVLPSIALSIGFVVGAGVSIWMIAAAIMAHDAGVTAADAFDIDANLRDDYPISGLIGALSALAAAWLFWLRFRLPFALGVIAAAATVAIVVAITIIEPDAADGHYRLALLGCGIAAFAVAMTFDLSDPGRSTIRADNAFWLHLAAAPLIVHSVVSVVSDGTAGDMTTQSAGLVLAVLAAIAAIALIIDRRALLVSGLIYLGFAIGRFVDLAELDGSAAVAITLFILGAAIVALGTGWHGARRAVVTNLIPERVAARLPTIRTAAE